MKYVLERVEQFPKPLLPGKLYYSEEFSTSRHLCACGCGDVIKLPIDRQHHWISEGPNGPTLRPSVGNWHVCDAHYFITDGEVRWESKWSPGQIAAARQCEDQRREIYYKSQATFRQRALKKLLTPWSIFKRWIGW